MAVPIRFKRGNYANLPALQPGEPAFTLDTNELYVGLNSTTDGNKFFGSHRYWTRETTTTGSGINLVEGSDNGSAFLTLQAPGSLSGITTFTLPGVDGSYGGILITDGAGNLTFESVLPAINVAGVSTFQNNLNVGGDLKVTGTSEFVGVVTFRGGTINLGDSDSDDVVIGGEFASSLTPTNDGQYSLGSDSKRWRYSYVKETLDTNQLNVSGVSTFQSNVHLGDGDTINLGDNDDLQIFRHSNGTGIIQNAGSGQLQLRSNEIRLLNQATDEDYAFFRDDGAVELYYDNSKKFETTADGIDVTGHVETDTLNVSGLSTFTDDVNFTQAINVDGDTELDNLNVSGVSTFTGTTNIANLNATGLSTISRVEATNIVSGGATFTTGGVKFQTFAQFANNQSLLFGGGNDLEIFHDGLNAYIVDVGVGSMFIRGTSSIELENDTGSETYARFNIDGVSELYYDNSKKIETTADGVRIIGVTSSTTAKIGAATTFTEDLVVQGDARVTGILTVGTSSIIFDGPNNSISVGGATTVNTSGLEVGITTVHSTGIEVGNSSIHNNGFDIGTTSLHDSGINADNLNISGVGTVGGDLNVTGDVIVGNVNISGVITASTLDISGSVDIDLNVLGNTFYVAETGSNSNDGDNINKPFLTIAQALSVATNGDVINVSAGIFEETCPLTVPAGVTVKGSGLRATTIRPTTATRQENIFLLNDASTLEDFSIKGSYYDSANDTGYAFSYATGIAITTRSPYIQRITVLNTGSQVTASDPYGYDTPDSNPASFIAGRGALVDGSKVTSNSLEAGMLFNEVTFFTPNNTGVTLTNGARAEYLNCFHYFASQAIVGTSGTIGIAGTANVRLKFDNPSVTPSVNHVVKLRDGGGTVVAVGTITSYNSPYAEIDGKGHGTFTVGAGSTQDVKFYQSDGTTQTGIASAISLADYTMFGAEMRSVGCAVEYGSQGVVADGVGVKLRLFATNFNHVGSGKDFSNDSTLTIQANEVIETNNGQVSYVSIDQSGDFRVGDAFVVQQETGNVSFAATTYNLETTGELTVTDGGSNQTVITPTSATIGNLQLAANTFSSTSGDITIDPAGSSETNITGKLNVSSVDISGDLDVDGLSEFDDVNVGSALTVAGAVDFNGTLDVSGLTELDNVNVSSAITATTFSGPLTGNVTGNVTGTVSDISNHTTDALSEGSTNLYYTNTRVDGRISAASITDLSDADQGVATTDSPTFAAVTAPNFNTGTLGSAIRISSNTISGPATLTIDPAGVGDNTGTVVIAGDLQVDGTTTEINSTTLTVDDKNIVLASGASNDAAADGGGITLESGQGNKTINWVNSNDAWTFSEHVNIASTKTYMINGVNVLSATTLGSSVVNSSLTSVGTLTDLTVTGAINSSTAIQVNGVSVLDTASGDATALAIALG